MWFSTKVESVIFIHYTYLSMGIMLFSYENKNDVSCNLTLKIPADNSEVECRTSCINAIFYRPSIV